MSLFVINRYEGEKEETSYEKKHLSELLKRIEDRKQEKINKGNHEVQEYNVQTEQDLKHEKKKKKRKISKQYLKEDNDINQHENTERNIETQTEVQSADQQKIHKTKKKKRKHVHNEENSVVHEANKELENENVQDESIKISSHGSENSNKMQMKIVDQQSDFIILGVKNQKKRSKVKRVLPEWLANPEIVSMDLHSGPSLEEMESVLDFKLIAALKANGIDKLFPVQASLLTWLLDCNKDRQQKWWLRDTCVSAPTGSGKTLAYVLPIVQILQSRLIPKIRCLIVVPVQELAAQVHKVMVAYTSHTSLKIGLISGASPFEQEQMNVTQKTLSGEYTSVVDIVIATPGRLIDHVLKTPGFSLDDLRFLVIDEADRAADWLEYIPDPHYRAPQFTLHNKRNSKIPAQKLLFSATLSQDPEKLNRLGLFHPILFTSVLVSGKDGNIDLDKETSDFVGRYISPEELIEQAVQCPPQYKPLAVYQLLIRNNVTPKTLVFTNSGMAAHRLAILLQLFLSKENIIIGEISAQLTSKERETVLHKFTVGEIQILVCSDALARGIDVPDVQLVISYDLPKYIKSYIHRVGRTGRAGKCGTAVSVLTRKQVGIFKHMLSNAHKAVPDIEKLTLDSIASEISYSEHIEKLKQELQKEKKDSISRQKFVKRIQSADVQYKTVF